MFPPASETEPGEKAAKEEAVVENTTPDYAAGLVSTQVPMIASLKYSCFVAYFLEFLNIRWTNKLHPDTFSPIGT